jgi:type II secretory pathway component PulM
MQKTLNQIKAFWMSRSLRQQMVLAAGTAATALLLGVFAHLMTAPD